MGVNFCRISALKKQDMKNNITVINHKLFFTTKQTYDENVNLIKTEIILPKHILN